MGAVYSALEPYKLDGDAKLMANWKGIFASWRKPSIFLTSLSIKPPGRPPKVWESRMLRFLWTTAR